MKMNKSFNTKGAGWKAKGESVIFLGLFWGRILAPSQNKCEQKLPKVQNSEYHSEFIRAIPVKNTWEGKTAGDIFFYGSLVRKVLKLYGSLVWKVFKIIWVVGVRQNVISWVE